MTFRDLVMSKYARLSVRFLRLNCNKDGSSGINCTDTCMLKIVIGNGFYRLRRFSVNTCRKSASVFICIIFYNARITITDFSLIIYLKAIKLTIGEIAVLCGLLQQKFLIYFTRFHAIIDQVDSIKHW